MLRGRFDPVHSRITRAHSKGSSLANSSAAATRYIYIGLQISGFLAVEVVALQPPNLSANDCVLLLVGVIIVVLYLFFSFTFVLLLSFVVFPDVRDSAPLRLIPFKLLIVCGEARVLINIWVLSATSSES